MSLLTTHYFPLLKRLRRVGDKKRRQFIRNCEKEFLDCISECCHNLLKGNVPLTSRQMIALRSKKKDLRTVAKKKTAIRTKRKLIQKGGFLNLLLPAIIPVIASIVGSLVK
jgi:hypothetical protein